jgi:hypothetical protein
MNVVATSLSQHAWIALAGASLALILMALVLAGGPVATTQPMALVDVSPFRWA